MPDSNRSSSTQEKDQPFEIRRRNAARYRRKTQSEVLEWAFWTGLEVQRLVIEELSRRKTVDSLMIYSTAKPMVTPWSRDPITAVRQLKATWY